VTLEYLLLMYLYIYAFACAWYYWCIICTLHTDKFLHTEWLSEVALWLAILYKHIVCVLLWIVMHAGFHILTRDVLDSGFFESDRNQILPDIRWDIPPELEPDSIMYNIFSMLNSCHNVVRTTYKYKFGCISLQIAMYTNTQRDSV